MIHNGLTQYAQLLAGYRRILGELGVDFTGVERFGETLTPVLDIFALPEWAFPRSEILFSREYAITAQAGLFSSAELVNPAGSGILAVVMEHQSTAAAMSVGIDVGIALGAVATRRGVPNDGRMPTLGEVSRCTLVLGNLAAGTALIQDFALAGTRTTRPFIIPPGGKLFISTTAVNTTAQGTLFWSERPLLGAESRA